MLGRGDGVAGVVGTACSMCRLCSRCPMVPCFDAMLDDVTELCNQNASCNAAFGITESTCMAPKQSALLAITQASTWYFNDHGPCRRRLLIPAPGAQGVRQAQGCSSSGQAWGRASRQEQGCHAHHCGAQWCVQVTGFSAGSLCCCCRSLTCLGCVWLCSGGLLGHVHPAYLLHTSCVRAHSRACSHAPYTCLHLHLYDLHCICMICIICIACARRPDRHDHHVQREDVSGRGQV